MDRINSYRQIIIKEALSQYTLIPYVYGDIRTKVVSDPEADSYLLMTVGWNDDKRVTAV